MQITRVHIQNYKSLYDVPIDGLKPLTIFVGPNDSGKSAILQSILLSGGVDEREWRSLVPAFSEVISHGRQSEHVRLELHLTLDDFARSTLFDAVCELSRDPLDWRLDPHLAAAFDRRLFQHIQCLFVWGGEGAPELQKLETTLPDATQAMLRQIVPGHGVIVDLPLGYILDNRDNLESALKTGSGAQQTGGPLLSTWLISRFKERLAFIHGTRRPAGQGELVVSPTLERDGSNLLAVLSHLRDHDSRAFDAVLRVMPRLVVEAGQIGFRPRERLQSLVFEVARQIEEGLDHKGAGVGDLLVLVTGILSKSHSITLLEEPEAHLHPGAQREFVAWLRELADGGRQFIMTTHSPALLGAVGSLAATFRVSKRNGRTQVKPCSTEPQAPNAELSHALSDLGVRPSDILFYDSVLFVEGPSDQEVFAVVRDRLAPLTPALSLCINPLRVGRAAALQQFLGRGFGPALTSATDLVNVRVVLDRGVRTPQEIESLKGLGRIHVLDRYEIENYLLNPAGLAAYVCSRKGNQCTETPDEEAIRKGLDAAASRCWAVIAAKRTRDLLKQHLSSLLSGLDRAEEDVRDDLLKLCEDGNLPDLERHSAAVDRWREEIQNIEWRGPEEMADWACDDLSYELGEVERRVQDADWALTNAPGSIILDTVLRDFGISYRKRRDARRLAECMPDEHWQTGDGAELREIVESLLNPDQEVSDANP